MDFRAQLLAEFRERHPDLAIAPATRFVCELPAASEGMRYQIGFRGQGTLRVALMIDPFPDKGRRREVFGRLKERKDDIERAFGDGLSWLPEDAHGSSWIDRERSVAESIRDRACWPEWRVWILQTIDRLHLALAGLTQGLSPPFPDMTAASRANRIRAYTSLLLGVMGLAGAIFVLPPIIAIGYGSKTFRRIPAPASVRDPRFRRGAGMAKFGVALGWLGLTVGLVVLPILLGGGSGEGRGRKSPPPIKTAADRSACAAVSVLNLYLERDIRQLVPTGVESVIRDSQQADNPQLRAAGISLRDAVLARDDQAANRALARLRETCDESP